MQKLCEVVGHANPAPEKRNQQRAEGAIDTTLLVFGISWSLSDSREQGLFKPPRPSGDLQFEKRLRRAPLASSLVDCAPGIDAIALYFDPLSAKVTAGVL